MNRKESITNMTILLVYILLQVFLAMHHEAWRDESQAWIIAKNASFGEILGLCASEGHPCLWFFILRVLSLCGLSFYWFSAVSIVIMAAAAVLFIWKAPFPSILKIGVLLSPIFFYYNPVICRVYSIVVLLIVLLCIIWPERRNRPIEYGLIVALLFQSHILVAGLAIGCLIEMLIFHKDTLRNKNGILGFIIPAISMLCMIVELKQNETTETFIHITPALLSRVGDTVQNIITVSSKYDIGNYSTGTSILLLCSIMIVVYIVKIVMDPSKRKNGKDILLVSLCGLAFYWGIIILIRGADHVQMAAVFWMIMLFFTWTATAVAEDKDYPVSMTIYEMLLLVCCILVIPRSAWIDPVTDVKGQFSGSMEIETIVEDTVPDKSIIAIHNNELSTSIAAYLYESEKNYTIWDIDNGCIFQIHKWGRKNKRIITDDMVAETTYKDCGRYENCYYISGVTCLETEPVQSEKMTLIARNTAANTWGEYYQLYELCTDAYSSKLLF